MTLKQFESMDEQDKLQLLHSSSVFLVSFEDKAGRYSLFQLDGFYVEVFNSARKSQADYCIYFDDLYMLEPYLRLITIEPVYELLKVRKGY